MFIINIDDLLLLVQNIYLISNSLTLPDIIAFLSNSNNQLLLFHLPKY